MTPYEIQDPCRAPHYCNPSADIIDRYYADTEGDPADLCDLFAAVDTQSHRFARADAGGDDW